MPLLAALFVAKLGVVLWGVNRGFDLGDEGFFLLNLNHPQDAPPLFEFYRLLTWFDPPLRFDVIGGRLLRIATELVATLFLAHAVFRWSESRLPRVAAAGFPFLLLFCALGSLLSVAARGFGYNDVTNLCMFVACGCVFRLLALPQGAASLRNALAVGACAGFCVGFQLFVKFPAALLLSGLALPLLLALPGLVFPQRMCALLGFALGVAAALLLFVATSGGLEPLLAKWAFAQEVNAATGYSISEILRVYVHHDWGSHWNFGWFTLAFAITVVGARLALRRRPDRRDEALALGLVVAVGVLTRGVWHFHAANVHPWLLHLYCSVLLLSVVSWGLLWLAWDEPAPERDGARGQRAQALAPLLLLFALPYLEIAGTNVPITLRLPSHVAPIFLLLGVLWTELRARGAKRFCNVSLGLLAALTSVLFIEQHVQRPYGLPAPLYRQVHPVAGVPGLRVDRGTQVFLEDLGRILDAAGLRPGDRVIAFDFMPGLVHYLDARSPGFPFYAFGRPEQNCWAINRSGDGPKPYLLLGRDMPVVQHACIRAFDFPREFVPVEILRNPYEQAIPYFFGGPEMPRLQIFAPADRVRGKRR